MTDFDNDGVGLGVFDKHFLGRAWIGHAGLWAGFTSEHWTYKRRGLTIADPDGPGAPAGRRPTRPRRSSSRWHRSL